MNDWLADRADDAWDGVVRAFDWFGEHIIDLFFGTVLLLLVVAVGYLVITYPQYQERQIQQCMRAFEYTHDQCEFMVRNHVAP